MLAAARKPYPPYLFAFLTPVHSLYSAHQTLAPANLSAMGGSHVELVEVAQEPHHVSSSFYIEGIKKRRSQWP
jgi:hypothetical protein